ncbi:MAG: hypothetical protein IJE43_06775 [Alphaproteobacteria bacterium]|nr:hypothetical protein [Alphaproteobacteria bacterium]
MSRYRNIIIDWSYPTEFHSILYKDSMEDIGIYYISRKFGGKESILYIGKTTYSFGSRLESHNAYKIDNYRGQKFVRLGRIVSPKSISDEELKELINDAEKTIIFYLSNIDEHDLVDNVDCTKTAVFNNTLKIKNMGFRGQLPKELYIPKEMLIDCE